MSFSNDETRDGHIAELVSENQQQRSIFLKLKTWKEETTDGTEREEGCKELTEAMQAKVHTKTSGPKCVQFRTEMSNGNVAGGREKPCNIVEASRQTECYKPLTCSRKNEGTGMMNHHADKDEEEVPCTESEKHFEGIRKFP